MVSLPVLQVFAAVADIPVAANDHVRALVGPLFKQRLEGVEEAILLVLLFRAGRSGGEVEGGDVGGVGKHGPDEATGILKPWDTHLHLVQRLTGQDPHAGAALRSGGCDLQVPALLQGRGEGCARLIFSGANFLHQNNVRRSLVQPGEHARVDLIADFRCGADAIDIDGSDGQTHGFRPYRAAQNGTLVI